MTKQTATTIARLKQSVSNLYRIADQTADPEDARALTLRPTTSVSRSTPSNSTRCPAVAKSPPTLPSLSPPEKGRELDQAEFEPGEVGANRSRGSKDAKDVYPGLFVVDGAAIPGALATNPTLTIAAQALKSVTAALP